MAKSNRTRKFSFGGGYPIQPEHKPRVVPRDFLTAFYNVDPADEDEIALFCQNYSFPPFWMFEKGIKKGFEELHSKYHDIIGKILDLKNLSIHDIELINQGLEGSRISLSIRQPQVDQIILEKRMWVPTLESQNGVRPEFEVQLIGHPEKDTKNSKIKIIVWPGDGGNGWHIKNIKKGILKINEIYPHEAWISLEEFSKRLTLFSFEYDNHELTLEFEYNAKTDFHVDNIYAAYSTTDLDSIICQHIWSAIQNKKFIKKHKKCVICGDLYTNSKSHNYC